MKKSDLAIESSGIIVSERKRRLPRHLEDSVLTFDERHIIALRLACQTIESHFPLNVLRIALYFNDDILINLVKRTKARQDKDWFTSVFFVQILADELERVISKVKS